MFDSGTFPTSDNMCSTMIGTANIAYVQAPRLPIAVNRYAHAQIRSGTPFRDRTDLTCRAEKAADCIGIASRVGIRIDTKGKCVLLTTYRAKESDIILHTASNRLGRATCYYPGDSHMAYYCTGKSEVYRAIDDDRCGIYLGSQARGRGRNCRAWANGRIRSYSPLGRLSWHNTRCS